MEQNEEYLSFTFTDLSPNDIIQIPVAKEKWAKLDGFFSAEHLRQMADAMDLRDEAPDADVNGEELAWSEEDHTIRIDGKLFRCPCGCNVFKESLDKQNYKCNGCESVYVTEGNEEKAS